jgi:hypothetical protein
MAEAKGYSEGDQNGVGGLPQYVMAESQEDRMAERVKGRPWAQNG